MWLSDGQIVILLCMLYWTLAGSVIRFLWTKKCSICYCYVFLNRLAPFSLTALFYLINQSISTGIHTPLMHTPLCTFQSASTLKSFLCVHETWGAVFVWRSFLLRVWHVKKRYMLRCFSVLCVWCWWLNNRPFLFFLCLFMCTCNYCQHQSRFAL